MKLPLKVVVPDGYVYIGNGRDQHMVETGQDCLMWSFDGQGWTDGVLEDLQPNVWYAVKEGQEYNKIGSYYPAVSLSGVRVVNRDLQNRPYDPVTKRLYQHIPSPKKVPGVYLGKDPYLCDYDQFYGYWVKITSDGDMSPLSARLPILLSVIAGPSTTRTWSTTYR